MQAIIYNSGNVTANVCILEAKTQLTFNKGSVWYTSHASGEECELPMSDLLEVIEVEQIGGTWFNWADMEDAFETYQSALIELSGNTDGLICERICIMDVYQQVYNLYRWTISNNRGDFVRYSANRD